MYWKMDLNSFAFTPRCKACGSYRVTKNGRYKKTMNRIWKCHMCGARCILGKSDLYRMRNHSHVVSFALELYSRGGISLRNIAAVILRYFGLPVSHGSIAYWMKKTAGSPWIPRLNPDRSPVWHIDETYINVKGKWHWLILVFCSTNKLALAWKLSENRSQRDLEEVMKQAVENAGFRPREIVSDGLYETRYAVKQALGWRFVKHRVEMGLGHNNPIERFFREPKRRVKWFSVFHSLEAARNFFTVFFFVHNFLKAHRSLGWKTPAYAAGVKQVSLTELLRAHPP